MFVANLVLSVFSSGGLERFQIDHVFFQFLWLLPWDVISALKIGEK